jgi:hypothetical protein
MVNPVEIVFCPGVEETPEMYSLLGRIRCDGGPGSWPDGTRHVEIIRPLGGGRSGGSVWLAELRGDSTRSLCVIKIGHAHALTGEWAAYETLIAPLRSALFAPVIAATPDVVAGTADPDDFDELAAVVYTEASDYTGQPGDAVRTLGELVADAESDPATLSEALSVLDRALRGVAEPLHRNHPVKETKKSLRSLNRTLGPSLALRVDGEPADGIVAEAVLRRTIGGFDEDLRVDDRIRMRDLAVDGEVLTGRGITLEYDGVLGASTSVSGKVLRSRGRDRRALLLDSVGPSEVTDQWWRVGDVVVADPFAALTEVLTQTVANRVYSRSHGDLNAGNVVVVGNQPCFIDYAHTTDHAPQQADHTWLEIAFLRDQFADVPFEEMVAVQRALAVSSRLLHLGTPADEARDRGRALLGDVRTVAFDVLFVVRKRAHDCYPHAAAGPEWWRDHLCHLLISAHRTLKWRGAVQSDAKLRVATAAASVATEWLTDSSPFALWGPADRDRAIAELRPRLVTAHGTASIQELLTRLQPDHDRFIDLLAGDEPASARQTAVAIAERAKVAIVTGGPRSGKSSVLREVAYRVAASATRVPVLLHAGDLGSPLLNRDTLCVDAVHLFVDGLDTVPGRDAVVAELRRLHEDHPDLPILVGDRTADGLEFEEIRLAGFDEDALLAHLYRNAPASAVPGLSHTLLDDPLWTSLDLRRPRSIAILDEYIRAGELPSSPADAQERMLRHELGDGGFDQAVDLAAHLLDGGSTGVVDTLVNTTVFVRDGAVMRFAEPADLHLLAARALRGRPVAELVARATTPAWDGAFRVLLALPDTPGEVVRGIIDAIVEDDPVRVGHLLRAARERPPDLVSAFVTAQQDALRQCDDPNGLAAFGCPRAVAEVVLDKETDATTRLTALRLLGRLVDDARPGAEHRTARAALTDAVHAVLSGPTHPELITHALDVVACSRLRGLELHVAEHLAPPRSWPVIRSAAAALRELGVVLTEQARQHHHDAARAQLAVVIDSLWHTTDLATARLLRKERYGLAATLVEHPSSMDVLLRQRFAFDLTGVADLIDQCAPATTVIDPAVLHARVRNGLPDQAIAAAHELLRDWPGDASRLMESVGGDPDPDRLLIAAAAVDATCLDHAEKIFREVLPRVGADRIEGLSALVVGIFQSDRGRGVRLAWTASRALTARDLPERLCWPWKAALARCRGGIDDIEILLRGNASEIDLAVDALGSWDVLGGGNPGPGKLSTDAEEALLGARPEVGDSPARIDTWGRAVAAVGLARAVPYLRLLAAGVGDASTTVSTSKGIEELRVADVVWDAVAHLTRTTQDTRGVQAMP